MENSAARTVKRRAGSGQTGVSKLWRCGHLQVLAFCLVILIAAVAMVELPDGRVAMRGLTRYPLPPVCASRTFLGIRCPGCGLTRSFIRLAHGDWRGSWQAHRLGGLIAVLVAAQVPYRLLAIRRLRQLPLGSRWTTAIAVVLLVAMIANWVAEVVTGRAASL